MSIADSSGSLMTPAQIKAALEAQIISPEQAANMLAGHSPQSPHVDVSQNEAQIGDEDNLRFIRGFSDVFISLGIVICLMGLSLLTRLFGGGALYFGAAAACWLAAEYFGRKKRAHLPTLIIAIAFMLYIQHGVGAVFPNAQAMAASLTAGAVTSPTLLAALIGFGAMALFYARFRLPFCIALMAWSAVLLVFAVLKMLLGPKIGGVFSEGFSFGLLLCGVAIFALACFYDMRDTDRKTRFSDNAFWLHLIAAPMIIHGLVLKLLSVNVRSLFGFKFPVLESGDAAVLLLILTVLAGIALALNRRALIAASLGYAGFALAFLLRDIGMGLSMTLVVTLLMLGAAVVFLGVAWHGARRLLLKILPRKGGFKKLFPDSPKKL
ncbi:MAG: hypothetical protein V3U82_03845 [Robiginitomaculum sp.]